MRLLTTLFALLIVAAVTMLAVVYSGAYNVGTGNHDNAPMNWVLDTAMTHSVQAHARSITAPPLTDPSMVEAGFRLYDRRCVGCHGAPGVKPGDISKGIFPEAPDLAESADEWTSAQLYWIIKNGLKFTSMPAWGPSRTETELWAMTAFVQRLPKMTPAEYQAMRDVVATEQAAPPGAAR
jgi:mono/diheme cytochrome c family protein